MKEVSLAMDRCDIDPTHESISIKNSVEGMNINTHENQECNNTQGADDCQHFSPLFDINECIEGDKYLNTMVNKKLSKAFSGNQHMVCDIFKLWRAQSEFD